LDIKGYKEGSKQFYSGRFWYYKNGKKKSKYKSGFTAKKACEDWCIDTKRTLEGLSDDADSTKVKEFLARWIKTKEKKLSPTTVRGYKTNIKHIDKRIGDSILSKLKLIDVQEMLDEFSASGLKYKTVKYIYRTLHAAMEYAVKTEAVVKNVCKGVEIQQDEKKFEVVVYSADHLRELLVALKFQFHFLYPLVLLAAMRGLRRGECLGLRWSDVDFESGSAHIRNNYIVEGGKEYHRKVKTKESERLISIDGFIGAELKEYKEQKNLEGNIQTYVCEVNGKLPDPTHISRQLKVFQKVNNLPECRFHDLRHTFAMLQLEQGTDLDTLKRLLGHSKIGITSDTYLHQNTSLIRKASTGMDNLIFMTKENENSEMSQ